MDTGRVAFAFRQFPLPSIHPLALGAAAAAVCAGEQGKFWEMHEVLFRTRQLQSTALARHASALKLQLAPFQTCLHERGPAKVRSEAAAAAAVQVTSTPTFFVGLREADQTVRVRQRIDGAMPFSSFEEAIEKLLKEAAE